MRNNWVVSIALVVLIHRSVLGDGGILNRTSLPAGDRSAVWAMDSPSFSSQEKPIAKKLLNGETLEGYEIELSADTVVKSFLAKSQPPRLFIDLNADGVFQSSEGFAGERPEIAEFEDEFHYRNIPYSLSFGPIPSPLFVDIRTWLIDDPRYEDRYILNILQCKTIYEGALRVGGRNYAARLLFRSLYRIQMEPIACILLDTNEDGVFHPYEDLWFPANWYAYIEGKCWTVRTIFSGQSADVVMEPYTGPVGTLQLQGEGIVRVCVGKSGKPMPPAFLRAGTPVFGLEFSLPLREDTTYSLPVDHYVVTNIVLQSGGSQETFLQWPVSHSYDTEYSPIFIQKNQTNTIWIGGPLNEEIKIYPKNSFGYVLLEYSGLFNRNRYSFIERQRSDLYASHRSQPSLWTMKDNWDRVVRAGQFQNGRAVVRMPFWGRGTYTVQSLGVDNELIDRSIVEFTYRSVQPLIWGAVLLVFVVLAGFLWRIDPDYPASKWWTLVPAMAGILWIRFSPSFVYFNEEHFIQAAGTGPLALTSILLACRVFSPRRIARVFFTSFFTSTGILLSIHILLPGTEMLVFLLIIALLFAVFFSAFYQIVRGKVNWIRCLVGYLTGTGIPTIPYLIAGIVSNEKGYLMICFASFVMISGFMIPLYLLTLINPWVHDLFAKRMADPADFKNYTHEDKPKEIA